MRTTAEGCAGSYAPMIWIAKTEDRRMIFLILVLQKGTWGLPDFAQEISSRGWKWTWSDWNLSPLWQNHASPSPHRCSTLWSKCMLWSVFILFPANYISLFQNFPLSFLYRSPAPLWIPGQHLSRVPEVPPDSMARLAEGKVQAQSKWVVEPRAHCDVFNSLSHALSTGPSCLSHNPSTSAVNN